MAINFPCRAECFKSDAGECGGTISFDFVAPNAECRVHVYGISFLELSPVWAVALMKWEQVPTANKNIFLSPKLGYMRHINLPEGICLEALGINSHNT